MTLCVFSQGYMRGSRAVSFILAREIKSWGLFVVCLFVCLFVSLLGPPQGEKLGELLVRYHIIHVQNDHICLYFYFLNLFISVTIPVIDLKLKKKIDLKFLCLYLTYSPIIKGKILVHFFCINF